MTKTIDRRAFLRYSSAAATAGLAAPFIGASRAQAAGQFRMLSGPVHKRVLTSGYNIPEPWLTERDLEIEYVTLPPDPLHERVFREAGLAEGTFDITFVSGRFLNPNLTELFTSLADLHLQDPVEDLEDISPAMRRAGTLRGELYALPYRHVTHGLHYNEVYLEERGLQGPPSTIEEFIDYVEQLSYDRDGGRVYGFGVHGRSMDTVINLARAWNGELVTPDLKIPEDVTPLIKTLTILRGFFEKDLTPRASLNYEPTDLDTAFQQGRIAMSMFPFGRYNLYNREGESKFPGRMNVVAIPASETIPDEVSPAVQGFWTIMIPKNVPDVQRSWDFIRFISNKENTILAALNGNGPVRSSAYEDDRYFDAVPYAAEEAKVLPTAHEMLPGFESSSKVNDIATEEFQTVMIGRKSPENAVDDLYRRIEPLLPQG